MLIHLIIKNYALIQHLEMEPSPSFNIITGETGAGKSIMIGAVGLLLGNRADKKTLYDEEKKCVIEGTFDLEEYELQRFFEENDLDYSQQTIIRREINANGKSRAFVNDLPVTLDILKELGAYLMDVHSQHDTLMLATNTYQLAIIDGFAGNQDKLLAYKDIYHQYRKSEKSFLKLKEEAEDLKKEADYNQFLLEELEKLQLQPGEQENLEQELNLLEHAEEVKGNLNQVLELLDMSEFSAQNHLFQADNLLKGIASYSEKYKNLQERTQSCLIELKDIINELTREESLVEFDPDKISYTKERLNNIYHLQQKHQVGSIDELINIQSELADKSSRVLNLDFDLQNKEEELQQLKLALQKQAGSLSESRIKVFKTFCTQIQNHLQDLGMPDATVEVQHNSVEPSTEGIDEIKLLFSANKGIKPQELKNVASGGEFSRLMYCVKYVLADKTAMPTIVFDEIDTGVSGEIALKMVKMMSEMSKNHQVIVITHLPQIAGRGDTHYFVYKDNQSQKAVSKIRKLTNSERVEEIAKMLGGDKPSAISLENAKELLKK